MTTKMDRAKDKGFFGGLLTALAVVNIYDAQTIYEDIIGTLSADDLADLIEHAKTNDELVWSGLAKYLEKESENLYD